MKFRKKPIVVEAEQFLPAEGKWPDCVKDLSDPNFLVRPQVLSDARYVVWNERGNCWQEVMPGDWIIHGLSGCRYPCKADIFPQIYEQVFEEAVGDNFIGGDWA